MSVGQPVPWPSVSDKRSSRNASGYYFRFGVSFRDVEELMAARGVVVSYETIRRWCDKFGKAYADGLRRRRARTGDKWHLDEVFLKINGITHYLWRAVDQNGVVLDILVQPKRDRFAAMRFFRRLLRATGRIAARDHYRQAAELWCSETGCDARRCSSAASVPKQPGGELASTHA